ncbi:MAG: polysaccharide biosynthesis/export family protein [Candidatus Neptunochlamydia sp.]|nr:polysaccharide biosynthesis/export family protein [Candidatus Neptunochlamydia sp.]
MKIIRILLVLVLVIALSGCSNTPFKRSEVVGTDEFVIDSYKIKEGKLSILEMEGCPLEILDPELLKEYTNTVDNGDVLKIALFHASRGDLSGAVRSIGETIGYTVTDGEITLPDIPPIEVKGLKLSEARDRIQKAYDREIDGLEVFIAYQKRNVKKIELAGMVSQSSIPVNGKKRLFEVLAEAKVPTNANFFKSYLVRDGKPLPVDMHRLIKEGDMSQNVVMCGGDKIYIAESSATTIMVMGEVRKEGVFDLPSGSMPLREALALAGGIPYTGDKGVIQVIRGNILRPKIYTLNWKHVMRLPTSSMLLMPGDIVYVAATSITEWNRFIQQILPTLTSIELFRKGASGVIAIQ